MGCYSHGVCGVHHWARGGGQGGAEGEEEDEEDPVDIFPVLLSSRQMEPTSSPGSMSENKGSLLEP
jgi:hypothetical protein